METARRLFARDGFLQTTVETLAREVEVSSQTIYATFGSKRGILFALLDQLAAEGGIEQYSKDMRTTADPRQQLRLNVRFHRRLFEHGQDIIGMARGVRGDPEVEAFFREAEQRRREGEAPWVRSWAEAGALRPELGEREAADILWALTDADVYMLLVVSCGWSGHRYEEWLISTLESQLFGITSPDPSQNATEAS